jgi:hypothetical protein
MIRTFAELPLWLLHGGIPPLLRDSYRAWLHHKRSTRGLTKKPNPAGTKIARKFADHSATIRSGLSSPAMAFRSAA